MFNGKSILITGGTGFLGKQYTKTMLENFCPKRLVIYSSDELKQFEMQQDFNDPVMRYFFCDVCGLPRLGRIKRADSYQDIVNHLDVALQKNEANQSYVN